MWPFKSKYEKLKREDVNEAICKLDALSKKNDAEVIELKKQIDQLTVIAKNEKSRDVKLNYVKKINFLTKRREEIAKRNNFLLYNIELMEKLKQQIDDNQMFTLANGISLNKLLSDQNGLRKFLVKSLQTKQKSEKNLVESSEVFEQVGELHDEPSEIYGKSDSDDELLANFEKEAQLLDDDPEFDGKKETSEDSSSEGDEKKQ